MKIPTRLKNTSRGFTLMEILVVITIIGVLGALSYGPIMKHFVTADIVKTQKVCRELVFSINGFESEYDGALPYLGTAATTYPATDQTILTNNGDFMKVLMGMNTDINEKGKQFFTADQASGGNGGLVYAAGGDIEGLRDKWGNPYSIRLDYDGNGIIDTTTIGTGTIYTVELRSEDNAAVASPGPDKLFNGTKDAKSWK